MPRERRTIANTLYGSRERRPRMQQPQVTERSRILSLMQMISSHGNRIGHKVSSSPFCEGDKVVKARPYSEEKYCYCGGDSCEVPVGTEGYIYCVAGARKVKVHFTNGIDWNVHPTELDRLEPYHSVFNFQDVTCHTCNSDFKYFEGQGHKDGDKYCCTECVEKCAACDAWKPKGTLRGKLKVCDDCYPTYYTNCGSCGKEIKKSNTPSIGDAHYCKECIKTFPRCARCGGIAHPDDYQTVGDVLGTNDDTIFCDGCIKECYPKCPCCGETKTDRNVEWFWSDHENNYVCPTCWENNYKKCPICHRWMNKQKMVHNEYIGYCCEKCHETEHISPVKPYDFTPNPEFKNLDTEKRPILRYGIEIETRNKQCKKETYDVAQDVRKKGKGLLYLKSDSSIGDGEPDDGFEIVSHPFTFPWLRENIDQFKTIFDLAEEGFVSHYGDGCGMHVHMSKEAFSTIHLYKFLTLFYKTDEIFFKTVSQRSSSSMDRWSKLSEDRRITRMAKQKSNPNKYQAINLNHDHTVEVRIFNGTLRKDRFIKNLELLQAAYEYTELESIKKVGIERFKNYIRQHNKRFLTLYNFLQAKGLI